MEGLCVEVQIPPEGLMVETEALNPDRKEGKNEAWVSEPYLRMPRSAQGGAAQTLQQWRYL